MRTGRTTPRRCEPCRRAMSSLRMLRASTLSSRPGAQRWQSCEVTPETPSHHTPHPTLTHTHTHTTAQLVTHTEKRLQVVVAEAVAVAEAGGATVVVVTLPPSSLCLPHLTLSLPTTTCS